MGEEMYFLCVNMYFYVDVLLQHLSWSILLHVCICGVILQSVFVKIYLYLHVICFIRNIAKMEDAKVEIDDGKDESAEPDTMYK